MIQSRTHNCNELRIGNVGERVTLVGWFENMRKVSKNLGFVILRDFYGTTQLVVETEEMMNVMDGINKESTISVEGVVRERSSKNANLPTGEIEVVPDKIEILGKCIYNALPFEINQSKDADENARLKYRYLDLRNPNMKKNIVMRSQIVAELRQRMYALNFMEITTPILTCSSPEGARDYLVPARNHPGKFYALPQAPQQFKPGGYGQVWFRQAGSAYRSGTDRCHRGNAGLWLCCFRRSDGKGYRGGWLHRYP